MNCPVCGDQITPELIRCARCGEQIPPHPEIAPPYSFTPNRFQFALLYFFTAGLYGIYWFFKTARVLGYISNDHNRPWRLLLLLVPIANIYFYAQLFNELGDRVRASGVKDVPSLPILAFGGALIGALWRLPDNWWYFCLLSFVPMTVIQSYSTAMQTNLWSDSIRPYRFRWGDWFVICGGALVFLLDLIGNFTPPLTASQAATVAVFPITLGAAVFALVAFHSIDARTHESPQAPRLTPEESQRSEKEQMLDHWMIVNARAKAQIMRLIEPLVRRHFPNYTGSEFLRFLMLSTHFMAPGPSNADIDNLVQQSSETFSVHAAQLAEDALESAEEDLRTQVGLAAYSGAMMFLASAYNPDDPFHPDTELLHDSLAAIDVALKFGSDRGNYYSTAVQVSGMLQNYDLGYDYATRALEADPTNPEAWRMGGLASIGVDRYAEAETRLLQARALWPGIAGVDEPLALARARK